MRCPDCGEPLDPPHPLGRHIPGCSFDENAVATAIAVWTPTHKTWRRRRG